MSLGFSNKDHKEHLMQLLNALLRGEREKGDREMKAVSTGSPHWKSPLLWGGALYSWCISCTLTHVVYLVHH